MPERTALALMGWSDRAMAKRDQHATGTIRADAAAQVGDLLWAPSETTGDQPFDGPKG